MTIQDLGSIGELVGAVATVATLLYLALQVRQNSRLLRASVAQASREGTVEIGRVTASDPETARVFRSGLRDPASLGEAEKFQFDALLGLIVSAWEQSQEQGTLGDRQMLWLLEQPGAQVFWHEFRATYSEALGHRVQAILPQVADQQRAAADSA